MYNANDGDETQSDFTYAESGADEQTADQSNLYGLNETYEEEDDDDDVASRSFASRSYHEQVVYEQQQTPSHIPDATRQVHGVYQQLLTLLSNPDDFAKVVNGSSNASDTSDLLPYKIFAPDAEVVLPQALTASQLFGVEQTDGIELEAAAGIVQISQLFLRWLALMPCGDHCNLINPPGVTVMRISGGRYRVTAAHRVIWQWLNDFLPDPLSSQEITHIKFGDLVSMTIVDVFETDLDGTLLSYCPTFDNRCLTKTYTTIERFHKETNKLFTTVHVVRQSEAGRTVEKAASAIYKYAGKAAQSVAETVKETINKQQRVNNHTAPAVVAQQTSSTSAYLSFTNQQNSTATQTLKEAISNTTHSPTSVNSGPRLELEPKHPKHFRSPDYLSDDDTSGAITTATRETDR
eukprot:CAMPEP_0172436284 /NCGR_PEP_ID=MMETSP1064-20121228/71646_1 /TAXON_ID=202472 /ORGANISM="Aulacoseira subarctica , Strain CCAP 1002/5" /LENGTH=406 /DNA_ID=CAMNT_0013184683 /DNA_START=86 /DNA_END=1306 /DNA_ORIENTATION=+